MEDLLILGLVIGIPALIIYFCNKGSASNAARVSGQNNNAARSQSQRQAVASHPQSKSHTKFNLPSSK